MTMRITPGQMIAGLPAIVVRDLLLQCDGGFRADWLNDKGYSAKKAKAIISELLALNYIEPSTERHREPSRYPWYSITDLGHSFSNALAARPITRAHAEKSLAEFMERVAQANQNPDFLYRVAEVVLYGSYLRGSETLGDIDLACRLESKIKAEDGASFTKTCKAHFIKSGRAWTRDMCDIFWPHDEVMLYLKNRKRSISLHSIDDFLSMKKDDNFSYEVLLGDAKKIESDLKKYASE
ncbi:MAG TPA: hypothetical protein VG844_19450 [Terracidiphilus sp.]|nr:hypothetical protein [Terracidiphilus sp.]